MRSLRPLLSVFVFALGTVFASFAGVVAYRAPKKLSVIWPGSYCRVCGIGIRWYDNIPVLSWLILRGKCRRCKAKIGIFSFLCEVFGGIGFMSAYLLYGDSAKELPVMFGLFCLVFLFVVMASIDHETHEIYDSTLIIFAAISSALTVYRVLALDGIVWDHIGGAVLGFGFFLTVALIGRLIMKREALGSGDIWIVGIGGLLTGTLPILAAIMLSALTGSVIELTKIGLKIQDRKKEIAFVPYLLLGIGFMAIFADPVMKLFKEALL